MKVTCKYAALAEIADESLRRHVGKYIQLPEIRLVPGRQYLVYGLVFWDDVPWFYLCEDESSDYLVPYCAVFFQLDDVTIPAGWTLQWNGRSSSVVPQWWAEVPDFLERLVDGEKEVRQIFLRARADLEQKQRTQS